MERTGLTQIKTTMNDNKEQRRIALVKEAEALERSQRLSERSGHDGSKHYQQRERRIREIDRELSLLEEKKAQP